jgi:hypothetical protein
MILQKQVTKLVKSAQKDISNVVEKDVQIVKARFKKESREIEKRRLRK